MAKKKVGTRPSKNGLEHKEQLANDNEELSEKMVSLQTLNNLLVRETVELREQVNTLQQSKKISESEKQSLEAEKNTWLQLSQEQLEISELEQSINRVLVSSLISQLGEKWKKQVEDMERLLVREGEIGSCLVKKLKETQLEKMEMESFLSVSEAKVQNLMREKEDKERVRIEQDVVIADLQKWIQDSEKRMDQETEISYCLAKDLEETQLENKEIKSVLSVSEAKLQDLMRERDCKERVRIEQEVSIAELQKQIGDLDKIVDQETEISSCLAKKLEETHLEKKEIGSALSVSQAKLQDLMKENEERDRVQIEQEVQIAELQKQIGDLEKMVDQETELNSSLTQKNSALETQLQEMMRDKEDQEQVRIEQEIKISELQKGANQLRTHISALQVDLDLSRETSNRVLSESDSIRKELDLKKGETEGLRAMVAELEKSNEKLVTELESLMGEKNLVQRSLVETSQRLKQAFSMVKRTGDKICNWGEGNCEDGDLAIVDSDKIDQEISPFAHELEAILRAFTRRVGKEEKVTQKLESLEMLVIEIEKKKSFWAWVSSATAFLAAASVAFVSKWG